MPKSRCSEINEKLMRYIFKQMHMFISSIHLYSSLLVSFKNIQWIYTYFYFTSFNDTTFLIVPSNQCTFTVSSLNLVKLVIIIADLNQWILSGQHCLCVSLIALMRLMYCLINVSWPEPHSNTFVGKNRIAFSIGQHTTQVIQCKCY